MKIEEARRDYYRRLAKKKGFRSRAAYKLLQIDDKYRILKDGLLVLDFGAAPGGWLQVASKKVGKRGLVIGVDLKDIKPIAENVKTLKMDVMKEGLLEALLKLMPRRADVILSDLSPEVSGIWSIDHIKQIELSERVFSLAPDLLKRNGSMAMKLFEGELMGQFVRKVKKSFKTSKLVKPKASRRESSEMYLVSLGFVG